MFKYFWIVSKWLKIAEFRFHPSDKANILTSMHNYTTTGRVDTAYNTNLILISVCFSNVCRLYPAEPSIAVIPRHCVAGGCSRGTVHRKTHLSYLLRNQHPKLEPRIFLSTKNSVPLKWANPRNFCTAKISWYTVI